MTIPQNVIDQAQQYKTKSDFRYNCNSLFLLAKENKWLDTLFPPIEKEPKSHRFIITKQDCIDLAKNYTTISDLRNNNQRLYNLIHRYKCTGEAFAHMTNLKQKWTIELCQIEANKYTTKKDFKKNSFPAYIAAIKYKWIDTICTHMTPLRKIKPKDI